jgi:hypothetical protein
VLTVIGLSPAWSFSIGLIAVFGIGFPLLVQGLIMFAASVARGEKKANEERRNRRRQ